MKEVDHRRILVKYVSYLGEKLLEDRYGVYFGAMGPETTANIHIRSVVHREVGSRCPKMDDDHRR